MCFLLEESGGRLWGQEYDSQGLWMRSRDKGGVHQRGLCQQFNFLYFRSGSYLNDFIDFLFPHKTSLSPGCMAVMELLGLQFPFRPPGHLEWSTEHETCRQLLAPECCGRCSSDT